MQPLQICIGPSIRIGRESWCLPYAGFFQVKLKKNGAIGREEDLTLLVNFFVCLGDVAILVARSTMEKSTDGSTIS